MYLYTTLRRNCRKYATPLLCSLATTIIMASLLYYVLNTVIREGFTGASEFVFYHMNGCPHCTNMMPEWSKFENSNNSGIKTRKVERGEAPDEVKKHGIKGFPSILLLDGNGDKIKAYNGPRTAEGFNSFCKQNAQ